jgi:hypothetical protein
LIVKEEGTGKRKGAAMKERTVHTGADGIMRASLHHFFYNSLPVHLYKIDHTKLLQYSAIF